MLTYYENLTPVSILNPV